MSHIGQKLAREKMQTAQKEALNNEIKGYLFEYLVARELAVLLGQEESFLCHETKVAQGRLREYEMWLRHNDPVLMERLPLLAHQSALLFDAQISPAPGAVSLCGRKELGRGEADIMLKGEESLCIGLKLCKTNAFVNTKSGGLRSFLIKYFGEDTQCSQHRLNQILDWSFDCMAGRLYESVGLEYGGAWDDSWSEAGHTLLPGELSPERSAFVLEHYGRVVDVLYKELEDFQKRAPHDFANAVPPLLGFQNRNLIQLFCFYRGDYQLEKIVVVDGRKSDWEKLRVEMGKRVSGLSSFEILTQDRILQIRVKPMNKFNARALKVNCSIKWRATE